MKRYFFFSILLLGSLACASLTGGPATATPLPLPSLPVETAEPIPTVGDITRRENVELYCPSDVPEATEIYNQALNFEIAGDTDSAIQAYRQAIELDPEYCDAMDNLALLLKQLGNYEEAISLYQQSLAIFPDGYVAHLGLANTYSSLEQYENAIVEYEALIRLYPDDPEGYYGLGSVYFSQEKYEDALAQFEQAEKLYEAEGSDYLVDAQAYIGFTHTMLGNYEEGRDYLEMVYPYFSDAGYMNYMLGICYYYGESIRNDALAKQYLTLARDQGIELEPELEDFVNQP